MEPCREGCTGGGPAWTHSRAECERERRELVAVAQKHRADFLKERERSGRLANENTRLRKRLRMLEELAEAPIKP